MECSFASACGKKVSSASNGLRSAKYAVNTLLFAVPLHASKWWNCCNVLGRRVLGKIFRRSKRLLPNISLLNSLLSRNGGLLARRSAFVEAAYPVRNLAPLISRCAYASGRLWSIFFVIEKTPGRVLRFRG